MSDTPIDRIQERLNRVNRMYIKRIARTLLRIGEMLPSEVNAMTAMAEMYEDSYEIRKALAEAINKSVEDVQVILNHEMTKASTDNRFRAAFAAMPTIEAQEFRRDTHARIKTYTESVVRQTAGALVNLSNTTAISEPYKAAVDSAVLAISTGVTDYNSAIRSAVRKLGYGGMQVVYESGYHRRLDTAIRQNILSATHQVAQRCSQIMGEALGYEQYELTAHRFSAPDHAPIQGHVVDKPNFERMQNGEDFQDIDGVWYTGFRRPIGEWNCKHIINPFDIRYSKRLYTNEQLAEWQRQNDEGC